MLHLKIEEQGVIELPDWIGGTSLTLAEIGAIACMACMQNGSEVPELAERVKSVEIGLEIVSLQEKGVLTAKRDGNRITLEINIDAVMPKSIE